MFYVFVLRGENAVDPLRQRQKSSAAMAKLIACAPLSWKVVTPMRSPAPSNDPPPEEPGETRAVVWTRRQFRDDRKPEMMPSPRLASMPRGEPML